MRWSALKQGGVLLKFSREWEKRPTKNLLWIRRIAHICVKMFYLADDPYTCYLYPLPKKYYQSTP